MYTMQRDPELYPDPEAFLPERWLPEAESLGLTPPKDAWMSFGDGARSCIGDSSSVLCVPCLTTSRDLTQLHPPCCQLHEPKHWLSEAYRSPEQSCRIFRSF